MEARFGVDLTACDGNGAPRRLLHPKGRIRNPGFRLRVWIFDGRFGAILDHLGSSPALSSRGASPPDLPRNLYPALTNDFFDF